MPEHDQLLIQLTWQKNPGSMSTSERCINSDVLFKIWKQPAGNVVQGIGCQFVKAGCCSILDRLPLNIIQHSQDVVRWQLGQRAVVDRWRRSAVHWPLKWWHKVRVTHKLIFFESWTGVSLHIGIALFSSIMRYYKKSKVVFHVCRSWMIVVMTRATNLRNSFPNSLG